MVLELTTDNKDAYINDEQHTLIDFTATWCGPCGLMKPHFIAAEKFMQTTNTAINFVSIDVDAEPDITQQYDVTCMPTLVMLKNGKEVGRNEGMIKGKEILTFIGKYFDVKKN